MMEYGRLGTAESSRHTHTFPEFDSIDKQLAALEEQQLAAARRRRTRVLMLTFLAAVFLVGSAASVAVLLKGPSEKSAAMHRPTAAIQEACRSVRHASLCLTSLSSFPAATAATGTRELFHASLNMTLQRVSKALYGASAVATATGMQNDLRLRTAYQDCIELMEDSMDHLSRSLSVSATSGGGGGGGAATTAVGKASEEDVRTWLSAALTNQDTCLEGFDGVADGYVKGQIMARIKDLSELVSNCLAIFSSVAKSQEFAGIPIQNRRRLLEEEPAAVDVDVDGFPQWMNRNERRLLQIPGSSIKADYIVSKDGTGTHKTIAQAVQDAPDNSSRRIIIYIKAGRYDENVKVARKKTNLMFVGDGKGLTIIAGSRSVYDNYTTFHTATFAATGAGFIAKDITFQNWAGPDKHQAVALRVGADHAVVYRCNVIGYQDTLYVHSQRQFFRECDIYGTVDFIFGNAAVVLQNCSLYARKPLPMQKNTVTAQNRKDPNQNTGISIHACRILPTPDLQAAGTANYSTYLGRPWKLYSRAVVMMSYIADHVHPNGWLEWNTTFALDTLYYGEYMNFGPGAAVAKRVTWPGFKVITLPEEANRFTVSQFITGATWLPSTGVSFLAGLSL